MLEKKQNNKQKRKCNSFLEKLSKKSCPTQCTPGMLTEGHPIYHPIYHAFVLQNHVNWVIVSARNSVIFCNMATKDKISQWNIIEKSFKI